MATHTYFIDQSPNSTLPFCTVVAGRCSVVAVLQNPTSCTLIQDLVLAWKNQGQHRATWPNTPVLLTNLQIQPYRIASLLCGVANANILVLSSTSSILIQDLEEFQEASCKPNQVLGQW